MCGCDLATKKKYTHRTSTLCIYLYLWFIGCEWFSYVNVDTYGIWKRCGKTTFQSINQMIRSERVAYSVRAIEKHKIARVSLLQRGISSFRLQKKVFFFNGFVQLYTYSAHTPRTFDSYTFCMSSSILSTYYVICTVMYRPLICIILSNIIRLTNQLIVTHFKIPCNIHTNLTFKLDG